MHLCYGDYGHQHLKQPESLQMQVDVLNALAPAARRTFDRASFTVPQARGDAGSFAPLRDLAADAATEVYFALVPYHPASSDGPAVPAARQQPQAVDEHDRRPAAGVGPLDLLRLAVIAAVAVAASCSLHRAFCDRRSIHRKASDAGPVRGVYLVPVVASLEPGVDHVQGSPAGRVILEEVSLP